MKLKLNEQPGFYLLTHCPSGVFYGGSSRNIRARIYGHRTKLKHRRHPNKRLSAVFVEWADFMVEVTYAATHEEAMRLEQNFLDEHVGQALCANLGTGSVNVWAKGNVPKYMTDIISKRNSEPKSEATKRKMSLAYRNSAPGRLAVMARSNSVSINGIVYASVNQASRALKKDPKIINRRVDSTDSIWATWKRVDKS